MCVLYIYIYIYIYIYNDITYNDNDNDNKVTPGNLGPDASPSAVPAACAAAAVALVGLATAQFSRRQETLRAEVDSSEVEPYDFGLFVEGLPTDATDEQEIKAFLAESACEGEETDVVHVIIGFDIDKLNALGASVAQCKARDIIV